MKRAVLLLISLSALAAHALAAPSDEPDPILDAPPGFIASAAEYNRALVEANESAIRRMEEADRQLASLPPIARFELFRREALAAFREGRARVEAIVERPYDMGFRAAVLESFSAVDHVFDALVPEAFLLLTKERVRNADLARLEDLYREIDATAQRCGERVDQAQREFARASGLRLREPPDPPPPPPESPPFTAPGIPPAGSHLDGQVHIDFALRYENEVVELQQTLASSADRMAQATHFSAADIETERKQELGQVRSIRSLAEQLEAWQGDESLRSASIAMARQLEAVLTGPYKSFAHTLAKGIRSQADADRANALASELNTSIQAAFDTFAEGERRFRVHWALDAYDAWQKERPPEAAPANPPAPDSEGRPPPPLPRYPDDGPPA